MADLSSTIVNAGGELVLDERVSTHRMAPAPWIDGHPAPDGWLLDSTHTCGDICPLCGEPADVIARDTWTAHTSCLRRVFARRVREQVDAIFALGEPEPETKKRGVKDA